MNPITNSVVDFIYETAYHDFPEGLIQKAKESLLDFLIVALLGSNQGPTEILEKVFLEEIGGNPQASIIGRGKKTSVINASLINGIYSHFLDYDDMHLGMHGHPSVVIFPSLIAMAEELSSPGRDLLTSFIVGGEVACRLGLSMNPYHYDAGWHSTATMGTFGAAAALSKLMALKPLQIKYALGLAGTQTAGLRQVFGTMSKPFNAGNASTNGLLAALLAKNHFTSSEGILDGKSGYCQIYSKEWDQDKLLQDLGTHYFLQDVMIKKFPSCHSTHPVIESALSLHQDHTLDLHSLKAITIKISPLAYQIASKPKPKTPMEAKFSVAFCAAISLLYGLDMVSHFKEETVLHPTVKRMLQITTTSIHEGLDRSDRIAEVHLTFDDGSTMMARRDVLQIAKGEKDLFGIILNKLKGSSIDPKWGHELAQTIKKIDSHANVGRMMEEFFRDSSLL